MKTFEGSLVGDRIGSLLKLSFAFAEGGLILPAEAYEVLAHDTLCTYQDLVS